MLNVYIFALYKQVAMMNIKELDADRLETAANMLKAIAHPLRIAILKHLEGGKKLTVTEIHELLGIEQSTTSHHLGILKDKGRVVHQARRQEYPLLSQTRYPEPDYRLFAKMYLRRQVKRPWTLDIRL